jgi:RNA polymerase sigma-70 factor (ECF subfamily)
LRYQKRRPAVSLEEMTLLGHAEPAAEAYGLDEVQAALENLDPERRYLLERVYFEGLTRDEVVAETGIPLGTVKRRLREALETMRTALATNE